MCGGIVRFVVATVDVLHVVLLPLEGHIAKLASYPGVRLFVYLVQVSGHVRLAYSFVTAGALEF